MPRTNMDGKDGDNKGKGIKRQTPPLHRILYTIMINWMMYTKRRKRKKSKRASASLRWLRDGEKRKGNSHFKWC